MEGWREGEAAAAVCVCVWGGVPSSVSGRGELSVPAVGEEFCRNKTGIYHHSAKMEGEDGEIRMGVMEREVVGGGGSNMQSSKIRSEGCWWGLK